MGRGTNNPAEKKRCRKKGRGNSEKNWGGRRQRNKEHKRGLRRPASNPGESGRPPEREEEEHCREARRRDITTKKSKGGRVVEGRTVKGGGNERNFRENSMIEATTIKTGVRQVHGEGKGRRKLHGKKKTKGSQKGPHDGERPSKSRAREEKGKDPLRKTNNKEGQVGEESFGLNKIVNYKLGGTDKGKGMERKEKKKRGKV